jgi:hypothetical protein
LNNTNVVKWCDEYLESKFKCKMSFRVYNSSIRQSVNKKLQVLVFVCLSFSGIKKLMSLHFYEVVTVACIKDMICCLWWIKIIFALISFWTPTWKITSRHYQQTTQFVISTSTIKCWCMQAFLSSQLNKYFNFDLITTVSNRHGTKMQQKLLLY